MKEENTGLSLFLTFFKIGAFTFGGGYAMIPLIQKEVVDKKQWLSDGDIADIVAIAETTPGPIAINAATFVGSKVKGVKGAVYATLGVVLPSFFIILLISFALRKYMSYPIVENAFFGIRIGVLALMTKALINMFRQCPKNALSYFIALAAFVTVGIFNINALIIIFASALAGIIYFTIKGGKNK